MLSWSSRLYCMDGVKGYREASEVVGSYVPYNWGINSLQEVIKRAMSTFRSLWLGLGSTGWPMGIGGMLLHVTFDLVMVQLSFSSSASFVNVSFAQSALIGTGILLSWGDEQVSAVVLSWRSRTLLLGLLGRNAHGKMILGERVTELTLLQGIMQIL